MTFGDVISQSQNGTQDILQSKVARGDVSIHGGRFNHRCIVRTVLATLSINKLLVVTVSNSKKIEETRLEKV